MLFPFFFPIPLFPRRICFFPRSAIPRVQECSRRLNSSPDLLSTVPLLVHIPPFASFPFFSCFLGMISLPLPGMMRPASYMYPPKRLVCFYFSFFFSNSHEFFLPSPLMSISIVLLQHLCEGTISPFLNPLTYVIPPVTRLFKKFFPQSQFSFFNWLNSLPRNLTLLSRRSNFPPRLSPRCVLTDLFPLVHSFFIVIVLFSLLSAPPPPLLDSSSHGIFTRRISISPPPHGLDLLSRCDVVSEPLAARPGNGFFQVSLFCYVELVRQASSRYLDPTVVGRSRYESVFAFPPSPFRAFNFFFFQSCVHSRIFFSRAASLSLSAASPCLSDPEPRCFIEYFEFSLLSTPRSGVSRFSFNLGCLSSSLLFGAFEDVIPLFRFLWLVIILNFFFFDLSVNFKLPRQDLLSPFTNRLYFCLSTLPFLFL